MPEEFEGITGEALLSWSHPTFLRMMKPEITMNVPPASFHPSRSSMNMRPPKKEAYSIEVRFMATSSTTGATSVASSCVRRYPTASNTTVKMGGNCCFPRWSDPNAVEFWIHNAEPSTKTHVICCKKERREDPRDSCSRAPCRQRMRRQTTRALQRCKNGPGRSGQF